MWYIDARGTARAEYDGGRKIVVRRIPGLDDGSWQIIVQGSQSRFPLAYKSRDDAIKQVELWLEFRNKET